MSDQEAEDAVIDELEDDQGSMEEEGDAQNTQARTSAVPSNISLGSGTIATEKIFSLTPATAVGGVIDYTRAAGRKLYSRATSKLEEDSFDCVAEDLYSFLKSLKDRAREFGWDEPGIGILSIPDDPHNPSEFKSLIDNHGEIELSTIRKFEETYIDRENRSAQDSAQLYGCLMSSISKEGKKKILVWEEQYMVGGLGSGNLLLKIIVRESHLDTNATSASIRTKLTDLDRYLPSIGHDISKFNMYVKLLIDGLRSRGETTQDLLVNLFKGYMACSDKEFVEYIKRKQDMFEEGHEMNSDNLMKNAAEKYKTLVQKGRWNAPDANEQKILALQTELRKLKKNKRGDKKKGSTKDEKSSNPNNKKPSWFDKRPKGDITKPREWKGKMWYYCHPDTGGKCDGKHRVHKPSNCQGTAYSFKKNDKEKKSSSSQKRKSDDKKEKQKKDKKRQMRLNESLRASAAEAETDDNESSSTSQSEGDSDGESE